MEITTTQRGFSRINFKDAYGEDCSLQYSSACDPHVWLGVTNVKPKIMVSDAERLGLPTYNQINGWVEYKIPADVLLSSRMHLNPEQVKELITHLQNWLDNDEF